VGEGPKGSIVLTYLQYQDFDHVYAQYRKCSRFIPVKPHLAHHKKTDGN